MLIIDGHNLIPHIPGLSLDQLDDEEKLIGLLQPYARSSRKKIIVFFDNAPPGKGGERAYGSIRAFFVRAGQTADDAIGQFLSGLGKTARNVTVISSDRQVRANARALHATVTSSEAFSIELLSRSQPSGSNEQPGREAGAPTRDVSRGQGIDEWFEVFGIDPALAGQPIDLSRPKLARKKPIEKADPRRHPAPNPPDSVQGRSKKHRPHHGFTPKKPV